MNKIEIKNNFHKQIDQIDNNSILSRFYDILEKVSSSKAGSLWSSLSDKEQQELLKIDLDTDNEDNLIPYMEIKSKHKKWLE